MVSRAREMCAGSNVQSVSKVRKAVEEAILFGANNGILRDYLVLLAHVDTLLSELREYKDRLEPDTILCDILNEINKRGG